MPRPPRFHLPGGLYLLTLYGNRRQPLVADDTDRAELERLLALALKRCDVVLYAYCWLDERLLLAVKISEIPLGRFVQRFAGPYVLHVQQRTARHESLFRRRYDARVVDPANLKYLVRFVHRAPVHAGLDSTPDAWPWSSHHVYAGRARRAWLSERPALRAFGARRAEARSNYLSFVNTGVNMCRDAADAALINDDEFRRTLAKQRTESRPSLPFESLDDLIEAVCARLNVSRIDVLSTARHRRLSRARAVIAWHATQTGLARLKQVAGVLNRHTSTLSVAMNRYLSLTPKLFETARLRRSAPRAHPRSPGSGAIARTI